MSNGQVYFVFVPAVLYKLDGLTMLAVNLLALTAAFGIEGLRLSNSRLASLFNVERRSIVRCVNKLKAKRYVVRKEGRRHSRCLVASDDVLSLLDSVKRSPGGVKVTPEVVSKCHKTGVKRSPITEEREKNISTASPLPNGALASAVQSGKADCQAGQQRVKERPQPFWRTAPKLTLSIAEFQKRQQQQTAALLEQKTPKVAAI